MYAWNGDGSTAWVASPEFAHLGTSRCLGSPIIADLDGDGDQDIAVGGDAGLSLLDGRTGADFQRDLFWLGRTSFAWSMETAPVVAELAGTRHLVVVGFNTAEQTTRVAAYTLPDSPSEDDWPMFRQNPLRTGTDTGNPCGHAQASGQFCDVLNGAFYTDALEWMVAESITTGVSTTRFAPDEVLTRAQMITFLWRQEGSPTGYPDADFTDVSSGAYYADAVRWATHTNVTNGTATGVFSPEDEVTRGQFVTLLWRRAGTPPATLPDFSDISPDNYFATAVGWARANSSTTALRRQPSPRATPSPAHRLPRCCTARQLADDPAATSSARRGG